MTIPPTRTRRPARPENPASDPPTRAHTRAARQTWQTSGMSDRSEEGRHGIPWRRSGSPRDPSAGSRHLYALAPDFTRSVGLDGTSHPSAQSLTCARSLELISSWLTRSCWSSTCSRCSWSWSSSIHRTWKLTWPLRTPPHQRPQPLRRNGGSRRSGNFPHPFRGEGAVTE